MIKATLEKDLLKLSNTTLDKISGNVKKPLYDRARLKAGIVHIGLGNFHRAHQAWFLHQLMQAGEAMDWAIVGAGVREFDSKQRQKLLAQDFLTTLIELDPKGQSAEIIGSMIDYVPIAEGNADLIARMAQEDIRIVSLTVTEGGYYIDPLSSSLDAAHPDIQHDAKYPETPKTVFGAMIAALKLRREAGVGPFTGQSCDNLQGNGAILRRTVVSLAALSDPDLAVWIDQKCSFPNSMVDCIVPATGPLECELVRTLGIDDAVPVTHENFRQWVIEDDFCAGRPNWEKVSVTMSSDVHTFESMKIQILNAGHQILANLGEIIGLNTIDQCMQHDEISSFFEQVQRREIVPRKFIPSPGRLWECHFPSGYGVRVDTHAHPGYEMPGCFDSLLAKLLVWGRDRDDAVKRMRTALDETVISGVEHLIPLHRRIMDEKDFLNRDITIQYIEMHEELLG